MISLYSSRFYLPLILLLAISGCNDVIPPGSPLPKQTFEGSLVVSSNHLSFSPCGQPHRWYPTTPNVLSTGQTLTPSSDSATNSFSTSQDSTYALTDSIASPLVDPVDTLRSFYSLPPYPRSLSPESLLSKDTSRVFFIRVDAYTSDQATLGPFGRFDRLLAVDSVRSIEPGSGCAL